jgi:DNA-binding winged helix-turn-helix (wHTH) protein
MTSDVVYEFGDFVLDVADRRLVKDGTAVRIGPRNFDVLLRLVEANGRLITKEALAESVWGIGGFDTKNLTNNISAIRKVLGDKKSDPQYIQNEREVGYRFVAKVKKRSANETDREASGPSEPIAGKNGDNTLFECLNRLATLRELGPISEVKVAGAEWVDSVREEWLIEKLKEATSDVCVVAYSFTHGYNRLDDVLVDFLKKKKTTLRVLMLDSNSLGFDLKTRLEGFRDLPKTLEDWNRKIEHTRRTHRKDIEGGLALLEALQDQFGKKKVRFALYADTPSLRGILIDGKAGVFSTYFIDPIQRGLRTPALVVNDFDADWNLSVLKRIFLNWFEIQFAVGQKTEQ